MHPPTRAILPLALLLAVAGAASSQSVLGAGDIGLVTTTGFWRLRGSVPQGQPVNHLAPGAFDPGFSALSAPRLDWERGTDAFLVCTGSHLYRVTVTSAASATVADLTPDVGGAAAFTELDIHPGTGDLYLYDQNAHEVLRFAPPFAAHMTPELVLPSGSGLRAMCLDSRDTPPSVTVADASNTHRLTLDGSGSLAVASAGASALDGDPQFGRTFLASKNADAVEGTTGSPSLLENLNLAGLCGPVALGPTAVAYDPLDFHCCVLAQDGVNASCLPGISGGNHVVSLPPAVSSSVPPKVITDPAGSGITGSDGDLALVLGEYAFPSPYGFGCAAPSTGHAAVLDCNSPPSGGNATFVVQVTGAPAGTALFLLLGVQPLSKTLGSGCTVLVAVSLPPFAIGTTDGTGALAVPAPLSGTVPAGVQVYLQVAFTDAGHALLSNGLLLHFAP